MLTSLAYLLMSICRLIVEWCMDGRIWFLELYRCFLMPYAVMPDWLALLLVLIWSLVCFHGGVTVILLLLL